MKALGIILLGLGSMAALAQSTEPSAPHPGQHLTPQQHMANLAVLLDLTAEQKPQFEAVLQQQHAKMKAWFDQARASGTRPSFAQMRAQHQQIEQDSIAQLTPVLNATQLNKFKILLQERASLGAHPAGGPHDGHHGRHQEEGPPPST
jgi:Spy/CpxP family protein refolding chaperone